MSKRSLPLSAPWVGAALLGAGVVSVGACGGLGNDDLFDSGAASGASSAGGASSSTTSTSVTSSTTTGQGGGASSSGVGPGGAGGQGGSTASSSSTGGMSCGDGTKQDGEACDQKDFGGVDCTSFKFSKPAGLVCTAGCTVDANGCKPTCGDGKVEPTEQCDDGNTSAGDGCDAACHTEVVTAGGSCAAAIPVSIGLGTQDVSGSTIGGGAHTAQGCASAGLDRIYAVKATVSGFLTANLVRAQTSYDSVLYLTTACNDGNDNPTVLCNDSYDPQNQVALNGGEVVSVRVQQGQTVYLFVDGFGGNNAGTYALHLDLSTGTDCNDPVPIPLEVGSGMDVRGSTSGISASPLVQGTCGGGPGGQVIYEVIRAVDGPLDADSIAANTSYNMALYARSNCGSLVSQLACSNNGGNATESIGLNKVNAGAATYVFVDGSQAGGGNASGNYGLTFTP